MTRRLPDMTDYYTPDRALAEEVQWCVKGHWKPVVTFLLPRLRDYEVKSLVDFYPATGHVARQIPEEIDYLGLEPNEWFLKKAKMRCPNRAFQPDSVRTYEGPGKDDLAMAFFHVKCYRLEEWNDIVSKILAKGKYGAFDMQVADRDHDNGVEFHHVYVTEERLSRAVAGAGHEIVESSVLSEFEVDGLGHAKDVAYWTRKC